MDALLIAIQDKKGRLDRLRPLTADALAHLQKHYDVELTYTSNAIEGNTLTRRETAEVIEHGITWKPSITMMPCCGCGNSPHARTPWAKT